MVRARSRVSKRARHKKTLKAAKGYWGGRSRLYKSAYEAVRRARRYATAHRKLRKREFRALWITRMNAACRENDMSYSRFIHGLRLTNINLDRKVLAEMAVSDPKAFNHLIGIARDALK
jgi:large subunit ribosomal protein L20